MTSVTALARERIQIGGIVLATGNAAMNAITAPKSARAEPARRFCADSPPAGFSDLRRRSLALETRPSRDRRRRRALRRDGLDLPWPAHALARAKVSKILQAQLRAAVLQRWSVVCREDREVACPAHDIASTGDERAAAVAAGGGRGEHVLGARSQPVIESFAGSRPRSWRTSCVIGCPTC